MENTYIITKQGSSDIILSVGGSSVGPRGVKGDPGANGASAGFGTPSASVTTLNPGSSATVSVSASGPDTEKVFNFEFGIPKGADGERGADGAPGRDGTDGKDGEDGAPGPKGDSGVYLGTTAPTDGSTVWLNPNGTVNASLVPAGGDSGQVLGKLSNSDLDYGWITASGGFKHSYVFQSYIKVTEQQYSTSYDIEQDTPHLRHRWTGHRSAHRLFCRQEYI